MTDAPHPSASDEYSEASDSAIVKNELAVQRDAYLRLAADFDNFKKRTQRDSEQRAAAEKESFIHELLPILDNLERALACESSASAAQLHQGVEMTLLLLDRLLQGHGVEAVEEVGKPFDPHRHEAVSLGYDASQPDHSVLEVVQRGYCQRHKVFRPAKVIVNDLSHSPGVSRGR